MFYDSLATSGDAATMVTVEDSGFYPGLTVHCTCSTFCRRTEQSTTCSIFFPGMNGGSSWIGGPVSCPSDRPLILEYTDGAVALIWNVQFAEQTNAGVIDMYL